MDLLFKPLNVATAIAFINLIALSTSIIPTGAEAEHRFCLDFGSGAALPEPVPPRPSSSLGEFAKQNTQTSATLSCPHFGQDNFQCHDNFWKTWIALCHQ